MALTAAIAVSSASANTCRYVDSFGSDLCEHGNNDSWLPDWIEEAADQTACNALSNIGCTWNGGAAVKCSQDASICGGKDEDACNGLAAKGCFWQEDNACDPHDAMKCTAEGTAFHTCTHTAWDTLVTEVLQAVDPLDPSTWDISSLVEDFVNRMKNGCVSKYLECFYTTDCGNPSLVIAQVCEDALAEICEEIGAADCPLDWCEMGVTQGSSLIDIALDFADDFDIATFFDATKIEELKKTIEMIAGGSFKLDWVDFDTATGKIKITIPDNTIISQAEVDDIIRRLEEMLSGSSSSLMTSDKGFAVKGVAVSSKIASIDNSQAAWEGKVEKDGLSMGAIVGIAAACCGLVAAVVGATVYSRKGGAAASGPKKHGGISMKSTAGGKARKGSNMVKGKVDMTSYV